MSSLWPYLNFSSVIQLKWALKWALSIELKQTEIYLSWENGLTKNLFRHPNWFLIKLANSPGHNHFLGYLMTSPIGIEGTHSLLFFDPLQFCFLTISRETLWNWRGLTNVHIQERSDRIIKLWWDIDLVESRAKVCAANGLIKKLVNACLSFKLSNM